ncbi:hypothetical protein BJ944DRAFT_259647 [Cunninghamella echinulata]|nr:hypothetical protein BJ944DRAFT_259647 [Cunninghamella echinulata]
MLPQYSPISNQDSEKQPIKDYSCTCVNHPHHQCNNNNNQKRRPSKWTIITLGALGLFFLGHMCDSHENQHYHFNDDNIDVHIDSDGLSENQYTTQDWNIFCFGKNSPLIPWDGKIVYDSFDNIKDFTLNHVQNSTGYSGVHITEGKITVAQNSELNQPRVIYDIKVSDNALKESIQIKESKSLDNYKIVLSQEYNYRQGCISINALLEVPTTEYLQDVVFKTINHDIIIRDELILNGTLTTKTLSGDTDIKQLVKAHTIDLSSVSGDISVKKASAETIDISTKSGDISGMFNLSGAHFNAGAISGDVDVKFDPITSVTDIVAKSLSGDVDVKFDSITSVTNIVAKSLSGDVDIKVPSDFESKFEVSTLTGDAEVKAKDSKNLHLAQNKRHHKFIKGYYGNDENSSSVIKATTKSGDISVKYN